MMEEVERGVNQRASVARRDLQIFIGLFDRRQAQQVLHEPAVRATDPSFEACGRDRVAAQSIDVEPAEVAVVLGED